jgi:hypothetical protein
MITLAGALGATLVLGACGSDDSKSDSTETTVAPDDTAGAGGEISEKELTDLQNSLPNDAEVAYDGDTITVAMADDASDSEALANCEEAVNFITGMEAPADIQVTIKKLPIYVSDGSPCQPV